MELIDIIGVIVLVAIVALISFVVIVSMEDLDAIEKEGVLDKYCIEKYQGEKIDNIPVKCLKYLLNQ